MSGMVELIKYFYQGFVLRDLLSLATPGAVVVGSALLLVYDSTEIFDTMNSIPFIIYLPIFAVCYIVGFALQCFGVITGLITFYNPKFISEKVKDNGGMKTTEGMKVHWERVTRFKKEASDEAKLHWERLVMLKQMCGNSAIAMFIAGILLSIKVWMPSLSTWAVIAIALVILISLYWGHHIHRDQQMTLENLYITPPDEG